MKLSEGFMGMLTIVCLTVLFKLQNDVRSEPQRPFQMIGAYPLAGDVTYSLLRPWWQLVNVCGNINQLRNLWRHYDGFF